MKKHMNSVLRNLLILFLIEISFPSVTNSQEVRKLAFDGTLSEHKLIISDLDPAMPSDWSGYSYLVMELRTTSPQRFSIWLYRSNGTPVRVMMHPFGQNVWLRAP